MMALTHTLVSENALRLNFVGHPASERKRQRDHLHPVPVVSAQAVMGRMTATRASWGRGW